MITKKEFKEKCDFHVYKGSRRINAIYFDWQSGITEDGQRFNGFKYMVYADSKRMSKTELFNELWKWVADIEHPQPSYKIQYRYAETNAKRFKVPLSL
jgi:hypothetical protein